MKKSDSCFLGFMKKFIFLSILSIVMSGCVSTPYVRSDIFLDAQVVKSIYLMPIVTEATIDSDMRLTHQRLQLKVDTSQKKIKEFLHTQLVKKGYGVGEYSKKFNDLDSRNNNDRKIKDAIRKFLNPSDRKGNTMEDVIKYFLEHATITNTDDEGNTKIIKKGVQDQDTEESIDPLISKTLAVQEFLPPDTDTVLYLHIKSHIAKRGFLNSLTDDSSVYIKMKLISISEKEIIFSGRTNRGKSDVLHWKSLRNSLMSVLDQIPVKL